MKPTILPSLKQSFTIEDKKIYCFILFLAQAGFVILLSYLFVHYYTIIMELLGGMMQAASKIDFDNIMSISRSSILFSGYSQIVKSFVKALTLIYLSYAVINGFVWNISNYCVSGKKISLMYQLQFLILALIFLFPSYIFFRIIHKSLISIDFLYPMKIITIAIILATWYFMMIAFALINKYKISQLKNHLKQTFAIGFKKYMILIPTYLIILMVLILAFYFLYAVQDSVYLSALIFGIFLFLWALVWSRLYFLVTMKNIQK